jgi:hypothetical protein
MKPFRKLEQALSFHMTVDLGPSGLKVRKRPTKSKLRVPPSRKLFYGTAVALTLLVCMTALQVVFIWRTGSWNREVFEAMLPVLTWVGGTFFGVKT